MESDLNLKQLEIFKAVIDKKGISAAARLLRLSPAAVSKQLKALEDTLNIHLVRRTSTSFEVTKDGQIFYDQYGRVATEINRLKYIAETCMQEPTGPLRVFSATAFGEHFILPYLEEFLTLYPKVLLTFDLNDRYADVRGEGIDLCFGLIEHWDQELIRKRLIATTTGILASPSYLERYGLPKSRHDLKHHRFICHANRPEPMLLRFRSGEAIEVEPSILVNSHHALISCAQSGLGLIQYYYHFVAEPILASGQLVNVLPDEEMPNLNCYLFYPPDRYLRPAARAMADFVVSKIEETR